MNPNQCRMARAGLRWTTIELAKSSGVTPATVNNFENGKDTYASTVEKLKQAFLETGRVRFDGEGCVCIDS